MASNYIVFPKAQQDLENIFRYISIDLSNPEAAKLLIEKFEDKFNGLTLFPKAYPFIEKEGLIVKNLRKCIVDNFLVIYLYNEKKIVVEIVRVVYGRQDYIKNI
ncbi:MAG: type II toxin-antitoxin system RelE/ParE family toxin [Tenericutes bacterium]|nr:type II toxin-antitoxin system RelE/ParE family toxin [Mycoplasmatota bacterium]